VPVITVPAAGDPTAGSSVTPTGAVVVLAVTTGQAAALTGAAARAPLAVAVQADR
jgi:hypothetical protein